MIMRKRPCVDAASRSSSRTKTNEGTLKHGTYHEARGLGVNQSVMSGERCFAKTLSRVAGLQAGGAAVSVGGPLFGDAPRGGNLAALRERCTAVRAETCSEVRP